jgi:hypothetical protein
MYLAFALRDAVDIVFYGDLEFAYLFGFDTSASNWWSDPCYNV